MGVELISAGNIDLVVAAFSASFGPIPGGTGIGFFSANGGSRMGLWAFALVQDPPENGFIEIRLDLSAGTVEVKANDGVSMAMSFEAGVGEGPTVVLG